MTLFYNWRDIVVELLPTSPIKKISVINVRKTQIPFDTGESNMPLGSAFRFSGR